MAKIKQSISNTKVGGALKQKASGSKNNDVNQNIRDSEAITIEQRFKEVKRRKKKEKDFISIEIVTELKILKNPSFDLRKLIQFVKELNDNYRNENIISVLLIGRTILNYIPPIFNYKTFKEVVNNSSRSQKLIFEFLEEAFRKEADFHTHNVISKSESLPSERQIEPFMANFEFLFQEIISRLK